MQSLSEVMQSERGRDFLAGHGIFTDPAVFTAALTPPSRSCLAQSLGVAPDRLLVYVGQQACTDYEHATALKFEAARDLEAHPDVTAAMLWHDMYQADAERFGVRLLLPGSKRGAWFVARALGSQEPRLIACDRTKLVEALDALKVWVDHVPCADRGAARDRAAKLVAEVLGADHVTLGDVNIAFASHLLREHLDFRPPCNAASAMVGQGLMTASINTVLSEIDAVIDVINATIGTLAAQGIDPQIKSLAATYLPLHFSCPRDGIRLRLSHERDGGDHFATATCRCGTAYRFHLGHGTPSLGELEATGRWSLDVSMPIYHDDLASGWVAGRSTALYGLIMNAVIETVFGRRPIPAFVPPRLNGDAAAPTLLVTYLTGGGPVATGTLP